MIWSCFSYVLWLVVVADGDVWLSTAAADLDWCDFLSEPAALLGGLGLLVAPDAVFVLIFSGEAMVVGAFLASKTHVLLLVGVGQTVLQHSVDQWLIAKLGAGAEVGEVVRGIGHGLGASGHDNVGGTGENGLGSTDYGLDARCADLVDGGADS